MGRRHCHGHSFCPKGEVEDVVVSLRKHQVSSQVLVAVIREGFLEGLTQRSGLILNIEVNRLLMWVA